MAAGLIVRHLPSASSTLSFTLRRTKPLSCLWNARFFFQTNGMKAVKQFTVQLTGHSFQRVQLQRRRKKVNETNKPSIVNGDSTYMLLAVQHQNFLANVVVALAEQPHEFRLE